MSLHPGISLHVAAPRWQGGSCCCAPQGASAAPCAPAAHHPPTAPHQPHPTQPAPSLHPLPTPPLLCSAAHPTRRSCRPASAARRAPPRGCPWPAAPVAAGQGGGAACQCRPAAAEPGVAACQCHPAAEPQTQTQTPRGSGAAELQAGATAARGCWPRPPTPSRGAAATAAATAAAAAWPPSCCRSTMPPPTCTHAPPAALAAARAHPHPQTRAPSCTSSHQKHTANRMQKRAAAETPSRPAACKKELLRPPRARLASRMQQGCCPCCCDPAGPHPPPAPPSPPPHTWRMGSSRGKVALTRVSRGPRSSSSRNSYLRASMRSTSSAPPTRAWSCGGRAVQPRWGGGWQPGAAQPHTQQQQQQQQQQEQRRQQLPPPAPMPTTPGEKAGQPRTTVGHPPPACSTAAAPLCPTPQAHPSTRACQHPASDLALAGPGWLGPAPAAAGADVTIALAAPHHHPAAPTAAPTCDPRLAWTCCSSCGQRSG